MADNKQFEVYKKYMEKASKLRQEYVQTELDIINEALSRLGYVGIEPIDAYAGDATITRFYYDENDEQVYAE